MASSFSIYESICLMPWHEESLDVLCANDNDAYGFQPASDDHNKIERRVELSLISRKVGRFMDGLSDREKLVAKRIYWEDLNQTNVARELGVSRPMVAKILKRVHRKAREALHDLNPEYA